MGVVATVLLDDRSCEGCTRQEEWGCFGKKLREPVEGEDPRAAWTNPAVVPLQIEGEDWYACPRQHIRENPEWWSRLTMYYAAYEKGFLPDAGAFNDQSMSGMLTLQLLDGMIQKAVGQKSRTE
jgi:hypothetical protein